MISKTKKSEFSFYSILYKIYNYLWGVGPNPAMLKAYYLLCMYGPLLAVFEGP